MKLSAWILAAGLCLGITGCVPAEEIRGRDNAFFPYVRGSVPRSFNEKIRVTMEVEFSGGKGSDDHAVEGGEFVEFHGTEFHGPTTVDLDYRLISGVGQFRVISPPAGIFRVQGLAGLSHQQLRMDVRTPTLHSFDITSTFGPLLGGGLIARPYNWLEFRGTVRFVPFAFGESITHFNRLEASAILRLVPHAHFFVGWTHWRYRDPQVWDESALDLQLGGVFAGVELIK